MSRQMKCHDLFSRQKCSNTLDSIRDTTLDTGNIYDHGGVAKSALYLILNEQEREMLEKFLYNIFLSPFLYALTFFTIEF